ncbi:MAG: PH domain-containing protein [Isosphaeraceae bacterium]
MNERVFPIARGSWFSLWFCGVLGLLMLGLGGALGAYSTLGPRMVSLEASNQGIRVHGDVYARTIPREDLKLAEARPLDCGAEPGYTPSSRTNGIGLPSYQSGWFRLANGSRALLFMTDWKRAVLIPTTQDFNLVVSPADPPGFLAALARPEAEATPLSFPLSEGGTSWSSPAAWIIPLLSCGLPFLMAPLLLYIASSTRKVRFEITEDGLRIRGDLFGRLIPWGSLRLAEARTENLKEVPEHRPILRTCGVGLPGYSSGWFRLKDRSKGLLFLTDQTRAVYLPTTGDYALLISPADPDGFLAALQA